MKLDVFRSTARAFGLLAAALCVIWACSTPTKGGFKGKALGVEIEISFDSSGTQVVQATGSLGAGLCLRITYHGSDGAKLGEEVISVPGSSQIPAGSVTQAFAIVDCPEPLSLAATGGLTTIHQRAPGIPTWREVYTMPITLTSTSGVLQRGVICHARVRCLPSQDPIEILQPILIAGAGIAVPPTIDVLFLAEVAPTTLGAELRVATRSPILDMNFDWNDVPNFGDLASGVNAIPSALPNGWHAVESAIPLQEFRAGLKDWNGGQVRIRTLANPAPSEYAQAFQTLAF